MKKKTLVSVIAVVMAFLLVMSLMLSAMGSMGALASPPVSAWRTFRNA